MLLKIRLNTQLTCHSLADKDVFILFQKIWMYSCLCEEKWKAWKALQVAHVFKQKVRGVEMLYPMKIDKTHKPPGSTTTTTKISVETLVWLVMEYPATFVKRHATD